MKKLLTLLAGSTLAFYMQGCSDSGTSASDENPVSKSASVYVYTTDYTSGELRWIDEDDEVSEAKVSLYKDSRIFAIGGNVVILEGYGADNIALFDPSKSKMKWQVSLDDKANPVDAVKANDDEIWVALQNVPKFVKVSLKDGKITKTIKTKSFINGDAVSPNLVDFEVSGDTLFALYQRLDGYNSPAIPGLLAMYKLSNGDLLDTIKLAKMNPFGMKFANGKLYVASTGAFNYVFDDEGNYDHSETGTDDARGIEVVDLAKKKSSMVVDGKKLGGGVYGFAVDAKNGVAYAAVYEADGNVPLVAVDLEKKSVKKIKGVSDVEGSLFFDDASEVLYVGERAYGKSALYAYEDGELNKVETATEDVLPPYSITVVR